MSFIVPKLPSRVEKSHFTRRVPIVIECFKNNVCRHFFHTVIVIKKKKLLNDTIFHVKFLVTLYISHFSL